MPVSILTVVMLGISNVFMTFAWYGHLKFKDQALWLVILASWGIAFVEYCFAVPANRWGSEIYSAAELKGIQEIVTLTVFAGPIWARASSGTTRWASRCWSWPPSSSFGIAEMPHDVPARSPSLTDGIGRARR